MSRTAAAAGDVLVVGLTVGLRRLCWTTTPGFAPALLGALGVALGLALAGLLLHRCVRRLGGVTGDVLGAVVEIATLGALLVMAR